MPGLLVLWDVDHTLINAGRGGWRAYQLAFGQMFGRSVPAAAYALRRLMTMVVVAEPR